MKAIFFDIDGTLLNTLGDIGGACNRALLKFGLPVHPIEAYAKMVGDGFNTLVRRAAGENRADIGEITAFAKKEYAENLTRDTRVYPGMREALASLRDGGFRLAVYSNKPDEMCGIVISHYFPEIPFEKVVGARSGAPLKPDPEVFLTLLSEMNVAPDNAFYAGDSNVDMILGKNANVLSIGAAWGFRGVAELRDAGAWKIAANPGELAALLLQ